jgi:uncharacterized membrane protein YvlD (DUF360 family)
MSEYLSEFKVYIVENKKIFPLIGFILMIVNLYFGYGFALLIPQEMGLDNPYVNGILIGIADLVGFTIVFCFIETFSRNFFHRLHIYTVICCSIILALIGIFFSEKTSFSKTSETIFSGIIN